MKTHVYPPPPRQYKLIIFWVCVFFMFFSLGRYTPWLSFYHHHIKKPTVTILMSTYNRALIVPNAIESVLEQTYKDFEFIIINDGSPNHTGAILKRYAKLDPRIRVVTNTPNQGLIASLNKGMALARGKYVARLDDDDKMLQERVEKQVAYMENHPQAAVLVTGYYYVKNSKRLSSHGCPAPSDQVHVNMHFSNGIAHPSAMFRTAFFKNNQIYYNKDFPYAEDYKLWQDIFWAGGQIDCLSEPLIDLEPQGGKKPEFYTLQADSAKKVRLLYLNKFFNATGEDLLLPPCLLAQKLIPINKEKNILNQNMLEDKLRTDCPKGEVAYYLLHPYWSDAVVKKQDGLYGRFSSASDIGRIELSGDILTMHWTNYKPESFKCRGNICTFINEK